MRGTHVMQKKEAKKFDIGNRVILLMNFPENTERNSFALDSKES